MKGRRDKGGRDPSHDKARAALFFGELDNFSPLVNGHIYSKK